MPVIQKLKDSYQLWRLCHKLFHKSEKYSLGTRIDDLYIASIEYTSRAAFVDKKEKPLFVAVALQKIDTIKILLAIAWESKTVDTKKYIALSEQLDGIGSMLGGWLGQLKKQNSLA